MHEHIKFNLDEEPSTSESNLFQILGEKKMKIAKNKKLIKLKIAVNLHTWCFRYLQNY